MAERVEDTEEDVSGAIAWARECNYNGEMRSWIELDPAKYGCEGILWTASLILLRHLEVTQPAGWWRGRRVLEFGSGTGHMAVGLARLGAHVVATESAESHNGSLSSCYVNMVRFTTQLLQSRPGGGQRLDPQPFGADIGALTTGAAASSANGGGSVGFRKLHWGLDDIEPHSWDGFEVVILSELYFEPSLHEALYESLCRILQPGMVAYSIFVDRPFSLAFLVMLDDDGSFETQEISPKEGFGMAEDDIVYAHVITRKPKQGQ